MKTAHNGEHISRITIQQATLYATLTPLSASVCGRFCSALHAISVLSRCRTERVCKGERRKVGTDRYKAGTNACVVERR